MSLTDNFALQAHWSKKLTGGGYDVSNDSVASHEDWKIGLPNALPMSFTMGAFYSDTDMSSRRKAFYMGNDRFIGRDTVTVFLHKTF